MRPVLLASTLCAAAASSIAMPRSTQPQLRPADPNKFQPGALRLRGGAGSMAASPASTSLTPFAARVLILLSGVLYGTYPVLLRALRAVGGEPLPPAFVTFARYQLLLLMSVAQRGLRAIKDGGKNGEPVAAAQSAKPSAGLWLAALELASYTTINAYVNIWALTRVSAVTNEILSSTIHVFVPLLSIMVLPDASFGLNTWLGCVLAFAAAVISCLADAVQPSGGAAIGVDWLGNGAVVLATAVFALQKVRTQQRLRTYAAAEINTARMVWMGVLGFVPLLADLAAGGPSRTTLTRLGHIIPMQWLFLALSVFLSAFIASSMQFAALKVISAANAQPFSALQPLFAAGWSTLLLSEPITKGAMFGGAMMIVATLLACTDTSGADKEKKAK